MKRLQDWITTGMIAQFVAGKLDPDDHAMIFTAAKAHAEVREAIFVAKDQMMGQLMAHMQLQDPEALIASGLLTDYAEGRLDQNGREQVEWMAVAHPQVSIAMDAFKRDMIANLIADVRSKDPQALIESEILIDYVLGACSEDERREIEMAAIFFPTVAAELASLRNLDAFLVMRGAINPPVAARSRFLSFMEAAEMPADGWSLIMPPLSSASKPADFAAWVDRVRPEAIHPGINLNAIPLAADNDMLTLFVVLTEGLEEETHLFDIERFLVLEGSCYVELEHEKIYLNPGDFYNVKKYTTHKVVVTSDIPCKLIVQQLVA
jgi:mannose-6-phosphate isomerase-like protein (cupin superfamily)